MVKPTSEAEMTKNKSRKTDMRLDKESGRWCAKLGRKRMPNKKLDGHLFRFNRDKRESERRKYRIQELWDSLVDTFGESALWCDETLKIAKAIADGESIIQFSADELAPRWLLKVMPLEQRCRASHFASALKRIQRSYSMISAVPAPEDEELYQEGQRKLEAKAEGAVTEGRKLAEFADLQIAHGTEVTVGEALNAYESFIQEEYTVTPDLEEGLDGERITDTARSYLKHIGNIREENGKEGQLDWPLSRLTFDGCQAMIDVWRRRPPLKNGSGPKAGKTCGEVIKRFMNRRGFFRWLHRSDQFEWAKPVDFDELEVEVKSNPAEIAQRMTPLQVECYTVDELAVLNEFANATERFLLLCGLNLGFKRMEISTLRVGELHLFEKHPHAEFIGFDSTDNDSFVKRIRRKSVVYGEWFLWPLTVQAMQWALERRRNQKAILNGDGAGRDISMRPTSILLLNDDGHSYTKQTKGRNPNHKLTNYWTRLVKRVQREHPDFRHLPHENLRDTIANMIRQEYKREGVHSSEIASIYLCHGRPYKTDNLLEVYANRPFGQVFDACLWLQEKLQPMFDSTPADPFPQQRKTGGGGRLRRKVSSQIRRLEKLGMKKTEIAKKLDISVATVYRYLAKDRSN